MADCLFCKIVTGDIPAERVAESARTIAFRDINPQAPTHVLVIPRDHYPDLAALAAAASRLPRRTRWRRPKESPRTVTASCSTPGHGLARRCFTCMPTCLAAGT